MSFRSGLCRRTGFLRLQGRVGHETSAQKSVPMWIFIVASHYCFAASGIQLYSDDDVTVTCFS